MPAATWREAMEQVREELTVWDEAYALPGLNEEPADLIREAVQRQ